MKRIGLCILTALTFTVLTNCNNEEKIEGLKANEILVVTLEILNDIKINEITLTSIDWTFVQGLIFVLRLKFSAKNPRFRQYPNISGKNQ